MEHLKFTRNWARAAMLLLTMLCCLTGARADEVTIGDLENATNDSYLPMNSLYEYSYTQQIYTADEIGTSGTINSITLWLYGNANLYEMPFDIYMVETDKDNFSSTTDWETVTTDDIVYSGSVTVHNTTAEAYTFELNTPFQYSGKSNLVICFNNKTGQWVSGLNGMVFVKDQEEPVRAIYARQDETAYDPTNPSFSAYGTTNKRNVITFDITPGGGSTCDKPSTFTVSDVTGYGATFAWVSEVGNYTFEYKKVADSDWTVVTGLTTNTYTLSNLEPSTAYSARVKAVCGVGSESGYKSANFTTSDVCPDGKVCIGTGTATDNRFPANNYYKYSLTQQIYTADEIGDAGAIQSIDFFKASTTGMERNLNIYIVSTDKKEFGSTTDWIPVTAGDLVFSGTVTFANNDWTTIALDDPFIYDGLSNIAIVVDDNTGSYASNTPFYVFATENNEAIYYQADNTNPDPTAIAGTTAGGILNTKNRVRLGIGEAPAVLKPTGVTVAYTGGTTATVSWTSTETSFDIDVNGTVTTNVTSPYELTNLALSTTYEIKVRAKNGSETSDWTNPVSFTTDACSNATIINYSLADTYGDGWTDNSGQVDTYIVILDENDDIVDYVTLESGFSTSGTLRLCGDFLQFVWYAGQYPSECSWTFTDAEGNVLFSGQGNSSMQTGDILYVIDNSPVPMPSDLVVSEIGPHSAVLEWTENGEATKWQIGFVGDDDNISSVITVTENPYTLTNLDAATTYKVKVKAVNGELESLWSRVASFTTAIAAPAPTALAATPSPTTAELSWKGFAEAYTLEYAEVPETKSGDGWLYYDNGTPQGNSGIGTGSETDVYWAVMFTPDMLDGNGQLSKVSVYESSGYNTEPITIYVYSDGDTAPGTLLYEETVNPESANAFHEITLTTPVLFDATKNLWIVIKENGTYPAMGSTNTGDPNGRWISLDGSEWNDVTGYGLDYTWMIRGYFESGIDTSTLTWTTVSGVNSPYTIEGLKPETKYMVRVKGLYGDEGESAWTSTTFTTPSECDAPIDPETADITTTSSTLKWTGYQESYNLYYRKSLPVDPSTPATIILTAHDVWGDGSGYQMLIDANANAYGSIIPTTGGLTSGGDVSDETYGEFEYKIPTNADGALTTENIVFDGSVTIEIPAGSYDWCITNPTDGDRMWIAGTNGNVPGRYDDFVFEPGVTYEFAVSKIGSGDGVTLTITRDMSDWTLVEDITNPYELTDLTPGTIYEWQVQGISESCGGTTEWSEIASFTTLQSLELADDESNIDLIKNNHGKKADVTLSGRTLWKDGTWNTLVLPFNYDLTADGNVLEGADVRSLSGASYSGNKLKLNFTSEGDVDEIEAGKPYIIRWKTASNTNLESPVFSGVTIDKTTANTVADLGDEKTLVFQGIYFPLSFGTEETSVLFLGADSKLYWPLPGAYVGAQRAIFSLSGFSADDAAGVRFVLDFGEDGGTTTGIISVNDGKTVETGDWYDLNGRKLDNMPARKGVYIRNGKKEVIK